MNSQPCPRCNGPTTELLPVETGMKLGLKEANQLDGVPDQVCPKCYSDLSRYVSQGARLRAERKARDANKMNLWRNRVSLVKQGRKHMTNKAFAEAAMAYEKYIKILAVVYECEVETLRPEMFKNTARAKELLVISTVYWDLLRIYDTHPRYADRQRNAANQLYEFSKSTPIFKDIIRQALSFEPKSKNRDIFKAFLKRCNASRTRCFIATASFESGHCQEVQKLCQFRDQVLAKNNLGRRFIASYYQVSPKVAEWLDHQPKARKISRGALRCAIKVIDWSFDLKSTPYQ